MKGIRLGLLLVTAAMAYGSTLIAGNLSFLVSSRLFPMFVTSAAQQKLQDVAEAALQPYFTLSISPLLDTLSAVTLAFIVGLCLSALRGKGKGGTLYVTQDSFGTACNVSGDNALGVIVDTLYKKRG